MLVLTRTIDTAIVINENITVTILDVKGKHVTLGIVAPKEITIVRDNSKNIKG
jgi:carbon storage regulator